MPLVVDHQTRRFGITELVQPEGVVVDEITRPDHVDGRNLDIPQHAVVEMQLLRVVHLKGRERADEDGASERRVGVGMLLCVVGQEAGGEGPAVGEAEDAVEGAFLFDGLEEEVVGFLDRLLVVVNGPWPFVEAEVGPFVEAADAGTGRRVDFALQVVEGGGVVFLQFSSEGAFSRGGISISWMPFSGNYCGSEYPFGVSGSFAFCASQFSTSGPKGLGVFNDARLTSVFVPAPCRQRSLRLGILPETALGTCY